MSKFIRATTVLLGLATSIAMPAQSAGYPERPIRMIAPSSAGGPNDVIARAVSAPLAELLGRQIVIDNRAGAAGLIGSDIVAKATPDGYSLLFGFSGPLSIVPNLVKSVPYDPVRDFAHVSLVAAAPYVLIAHPSLPVKSVKELVALAKSQPGKYNFASGGTGTGIHMAGELLNMAADIRIVHVPYKGAGPGMTALLANEVNVMFNGLSAALPHVKSNRLRALAVGGDKRSNLLPELPTVAESGLKFSIAGWYSLSGPKGMPRPIVARLHKETLRALDNAELKERFNALAVEAIGSTPEEFTAMLKDEIAKWALVVKASGIKVE
ncbi:MAG: Bug family tripartite tricarboxylate transporter substrate binding protein [Betaproteobacteria bacterium]